MIIAKLILKFKWFIIAGIALITVASIVLIPRLTTDVDFSNFFPEGDSEVAYHQKFKDLVGSNDHFIAIAILSDKSLFDSTFLQKVHRFTLDARTIQNIEAVTSLTNLSRYHKTPIGIITLPYIHLNQGDKLSQDSVMIYKEFDRTRQYISTNGKSLTIIVQIKQNLSPSAIDSIINKLEELLRSYQFSETHMIGKKLIEVHYQRLMKSELSRSVIMSTGIIILILILFYRSFIGVALPLITMIIALITLYGFMALTGRSLGIMSSLFPTIILIVGISDAIHIITKYNLESLKNHSYSKAIKTIISEIGLSIFLTSLTTALGFLTLTTSSMPALRDFGIDASVGIVITFLISILFVPTVLILLRSKKIKKIKVDILKWSILSDRIYQITKNRQSTIWLVMLALLILSTIGIFNINTNNLQIANIPRHHQLKKDYEFFDENHGGTRNLELAVEVRGSWKINQVEILAELSKLHEHLESNPSIHYLISPINWYYEIGKVFNHGLAPLEIPNNNALIEKYEKDLLKYQNKNSWKLVDDSKKYGRITARMKDLGRQEVGKLNLELTNWINSEIDTSKLAFHFVGMDRMIDRGHEHRINNMLWGILFAQLAVALLIGLLFRSSKMVIITLIVNIIPLILIAGLMGFSGIELRGTTSIIFAVGFVISVDDTIHFLSKFRIERKKGLSVDDSIRITLQESGKAIFTTSMILFAGFIVLLFSAFGDVYSVGFMISAMIIIALLADLFLLPILLRKMLKNKSNESS